MVPKLLRAYCIARGGGPHTWHQEPEQRPAGGSLGVGNGALAPDGVKQRGRSFP